jgi:hypothetical protein
MALAARIERAEKCLTESLGRAVMTSDPAARAFVEAIGGGVAVYAGPSSPMNKIIGVGFDGAPSSQRLAEIEDLFRERGAPLQTEVATLADPTFAAELTRRGYQLRNFENVSGRSIGTADEDPPDAPGIRIELMTERNTADWIDVAITGFQHPDGKGVPANELPAREALDAALRPFATVDGFRRYCAWVDGRLAGVATLRCNLGPWEGPTPRRSGFGGEAGCALTRIADGVAQLCGATTLPAFRRRGVQGALLRRRLADGARAGCDLAVITTQPGSTSQENSHRHGFALLYARAILVKDPTT